jgi:hypothetical protein
MNENGTANLHKILANKILPPNPRGEFSTAIGLPDGIRIVIAPRILKRAGIGILLSAMVPWRSTMRELSAEARLHLHALTVSGRTVVRIQKLALYSAFALIAAIVFGSSSIHPF